MPVAANPLLRCESRVGANARQIQVTFENVSSTPVVILRWHSPLDAWFSEFLLVSQQGKMVPYQGAKAKRLTPTAEDLLLLASGEVHDETLDLAEVYSLSSSALQVQFHPIAVMPIALGQPLVWQAERQQLVDCNTLQLPQI